MEKCICYLIMTTKEHTKNHVCAFEKCFWTLSAYMLSVSHVTAGA